MRARVDKVGEVSTPASPSGSDPRLPTSGPGSPAGWPRRIAALLVDWLLANAAGYALTGGVAVWSPDSGRTWVPLVTFFVLVAAATAATGASFGQWILGVRIIDVRGRRVGVVAAAIRTALILLVIPPLVFTREGRGLHDLATSTAAVRGPDRG